MPREKTTATHTLSTYIGPDAALDFVRGEVAVLRLHLFLVHFDKVIHAAGHEVAHFLAVEQLVLSRESLEHVVELRHSKKK